MAVLSVGMPVMIWSRLLSLIVLAQASFGARTLARLARTAGGPTIEPAAGTQPGQRVSVIVPVLDERGRLGPCLDGLLAQGDEVAEIIVVDGGSTDGTPDLARAYAARDARVRLVDASPVPPDWNGKAWGLHIGGQAVSSASSWILMIDADVRVEPGLTRALLAHAAQHHLAVFSVATRQQIEGWAENLLHPAMLTTLVYRFGIPGQVVTDPAAAQASGPCFLIRRTLLESSGGFGRVRDSICEDVSFARLLAADGEPVGFFEAGDLVWTRMYESGADVWRGWTRSLPMRDRFARRRWAVGLLEVLLVQALPLPLLVALLWRHQHDWRLGVALALVITRLGVLAGTARAYRARAWTYWLSPLLDLPVALQLWRRAFQRRHRWRGRVVTQGR